MKINYALVSRSLIALLFVFAGVEKLLNFNGTSGFVGTLPGLSIPILATIATAIVIVIEIPIALAFAWGYKLCTTGTILIGFTVLVTILVHNHLPADLVMIMKNIAIIGGILGAITLCDCGNCPMGHGAKSNKGIRS